MNIVVCLKLVAATTADIRISADTKSLQLTGVETVINPYDEYALEAALKLREAFKGSAITALTVGGDEALKALQHAFSVGVDSAVHIKASGLDSLAATRAAAAALKGTPPDLVLCGRQAIDDDLWLFPGALAEFLDFAHATAVSGLDISADGKQAKCRSRAGADEQVLEVRLPAVISCDKGLNEPRAPTLKGRLDAKKKQPAVKTPGDLGLSASELEPALDIQQFLPPPQKTQGKIISGAPAETAAELVKLLREEAKII